MRHDSLLDNLVDLLKKHAKATGRKFKLPKPPRIFPPVIPQRQYLGELRQFNAALKEVFKNKIGPILASIIRQAVSSRPRGDGFLFKGDDFVDQIDTAFKSARVLFYSKYTDTEISNLASRAARRASSWNANQINNIFGKVLNVRPAGNESWLNQEIKAFTKANVSLITSISENYFDRVERDVTRAAQKGELTGALAQDIQAAYDVTESRAALIARDQISKFNSDLTKTRQQSVGVNKYQWSTSNDERVRPSHAEKEGKIFSWDEPPPDTGNPGEDIQCRCVAIPVFDNSES